MVTGKGANIHSLHHSDMNLLQGQTESIKEDISGETLETYKYPYFQRFFFFLLALMVTFNLYGQGNNKVKIDDTKGKYLRREKLHETRWTNLDRYTDYDPDTLYISESLLAKDYLNNKNGISFRRTPLSLKQGWTNLFSEEEADHSVYIGSLGNYDMNNGRKGYTITWLIYHDSLFIKDITLRTDKYVVKKLSRDTIVSRLENFTNSKFKNGLLFVDWISGEFGVIFNFNPLTLEYSDNFDNFYEGTVVDSGYVIAFYKGKVVKVEEDNRTHRN
jgi:hypothetical protein